MYLWKIEKLKDELKANNLSQKDGLLYLLISTLFLSIVMEISEYMESIIPNIFHILMSVSTIMIPLVATILIFKSNGGDCGTDFLGRFISISFVVSIRIFVLALLLIIAIAVNVIFLEDIDHIIDQILYICIILMQILMYLRIYKHMKDIR
jgi:hypothetical protein